MPIPAEDFEAIRTTLRRFPQLEWACLYGSSLRRNDYEDIDIALRSSKRLAPAKRSSTEASVYSALVSSLLAPKRLTESARESGFIDLHWFEDLPLALRHRVVRQGKTLLDRHPRRTRRMERLVSREYLDFEPAYHRMMDQLVDRMHSRLHDSRR